MTIVASIVASACCITGIVTHVAHNVACSGIVKPDDGRPAMWFAGENNANVVAEIVGADAIATGDRVEICGETSALGFAPGIAAKSIRYLGKGAFGPAEEVRLRDLDWGVKDNERVAMTGVLTSVKPADAKHVRLSVETADGAFAVEAPASFADWPSLIDAELRLEGPAMSLFNVRGEFIGVLLHIESPDGVSVVSPAGDSFARPITPLGSIMPYSPSGPDLHRRHVKGVVTYVREGVCGWLQDGDATLKVYASGTDAKPGDEVEAVGFVSREEGLGRLVSATVRVVGHPGLPEPIRIGWVELGSYPVDTSGKFLNFDGRRVVFDGKLLSCVALSKGVELLVEADQGHCVEVFCDEKIPGLSPGDAAWGPTLSVVGVMELEQVPGVPEGQMPEISSWNIRVASASDIEIFHNDAWASHQIARVFNYIVVGLLALASVAFVVFAVYLVRLRAEHRRQDILVAERKRMAADLHDTLEQHLAGARMMLNSAVKFTPDVPDGVKSAVSSADELLAHAKSEMRARIFDMRSDVLFTLGPEKVIKSIAERIAKSGVVKSHVRLRGLPEHIPEAMFSEIVFIVQEAITNAVKHGHCRNIAITVDPQGEGFALAVANDGEPFDADAVLGPEAGHYGLSGMKERAKRTGINLSFGRSGRWTVVRLVVGSALRRR